ncbi:hypothetical protein IWX90DRAFT_218887 [Phyllosticta citrichinensis]|uniref:Uncharacterized protein n=1 Tax=Phyllosticta citrichinensis TaxID=1130410 RepID=A0ABR1XTW2_9PEZI
MAFDRLVVCPPPCLPAQTTPIKFIFTAQLFPQPLRPKGQPPNQPRRLRACLRAKHPNRGKVSRPADHARGSKDAFKDQFYWKMRTKAAHHIIQRQVSFARPAPRASRIRRGQIQHRPRLNPSKPLFWPSADGSTHPCPGRPATALPGTLPTRFSDGLRPARAVPLHPPKRACCYARETGGDREGVGESQTGWRQGRVFARFFGPKADLTLTAIIYLRPLPRLGKPRSSYLLPSIRTTRRSSPKQAGELVVGERCVPRFTVNRQAP